MQLLDRQNWDLWAAEPLVGSFRYDDEGTNNIVHFPAMDLQSHYHDVKPNYNLRIGGGAAANKPNAQVFNEQQAFPDPDVVLLTRKGNKFIGSGVKANQDRAGVLSLENNDGENGDWWMGLFDGHGFYGHVVSQYCIYEFPKRLLNAIANNNKNDNNRLTKEGIPKVLQQIFLDIDHSLPQLEGAGTTGISIWKRQDSLYISNVGDSKAFVASYDASTGKPVKILYETQPHKPDDPNERARIEGIGGTVLDPPQPGASARVLIPDPTDPFMSMALAMSRSIGDHEGTAYGVIAEPTTDVIDLAEYEDLDNNHDLQYMVVVCSDGLLDKVPLMEVAEYMAQSLLPTTSLMPLEAAEQLIVQSSMSWLRDPMGGDGYRDDITLAVHRLRI
jgi:serine/threonine protein phosphatase PrpC